MNNEYFDLFDDIEYDDYEEKEKDHRRQKKTIGVDPSPGEYGEHVFIYKGFKSRHVGNRNDCLRNFMGCLSVRESDLNKIVVQTNRIKG
jgi:hypothetical protein